MAEQEVTEKPSYNWGEVTGKVVERLRAPKVVPVDPAIVRQAQRSWDGVQHPDDPEGELRHVLSHEFASDAMAAEFARLIRKAGDHTKPQTSVSAVIDPQNSGNLREVNWKAGSRRGRATS